MKKLIPILVMLAVIALLAWVKVKYFPRSKPQGMGGPAAAGAPGAPGPAMQVSGVVLRSERIGDKLYAYGTLLANEEIELRPEASGRVMQLSFREGTWVQKGDLLLKINDAELQAQLKKLQYEEKLALENEQRQKQLRDIQAISQELYDAAVNRVQALRADIELVRAQLDKTELRAPFSGKTSFRSIAEGSYVTPATVVANLLQTSPIEVELSIPEKYAAEIRIGDKLQFSPEGTTEMFSATVSVLAPQIDLATRTLSLRATAPNPGGKLLPGASARVELSLRETDGNLLIPTQAIIPVLKGKQVLVARNGKAQPVDIETGLRTESKVQVIRGLSAGDTVITSGILQLKPGMAVRVNTD